MPPQEPLPGGGERPATWEDLIQFEARKAKVPPALALEVARQESLFNPEAVSPKGARGLFQLMPATAQELGVDPADPVQNIRGGVTYLRQQLEKYQGDVPKALAAYNFGPGNVDQGLPYPEETRRYIARITSRLGGGQPRPQPGPQPVSTRVAQPPPQAPEPGFWQTMTSGFDLSTRAGRRNLMGAVGAASGGLIATGVGVPAGVGVGASALLGATLLGGGQEAWESLTESLVGAPPPSGYASTAAERIPNAMWEQGVYEFLGQTFMWPLKAAGRRLLATPVGKQASEALSRSKDAVVQQMGEALTTARRALRDAREAASRAVEGARTAGEPGVSAAKETLRQTRAAGAEAVAGARTDIAGQIERARATGEAGISAAEQEAARRTGAVQERFGRIGAPPPPSEAGRRARAIIEGPAKQARDEVGQMVDQAAEAGPPVDITALKDEARRILAEEIRPPATAFPRAGQEAPELMHPGVSLANMPPGPQADAVRAAMQQVEDQAATELLQHPAMRTIGRILNAEDTVPFAAAHQFKRDLDEAIGTAWEQSVRKRVTNITKTLRGTLRESLRGYAPYDQATAAYQAIAPLYTKGLAPRLRRVAVNDPGAVVHLLSPRRPEEARMLRDLLVAQPAAVGQRPAGQAAWDSVRSAWTYEKLIKPAKLGNLEAMIGKLDPDFDQVIFGDGVGAQIKENLIQIDRAFHHATESGDALIEAAKEAAASGVATARREGARAIRGVRGAVRAATMEAQQGVEAAKGAQAAGARQATTTGRANVALRREELAGTQVARDVSLAPIESEQKELFYSRLGASPPIGGLVPWRLGLIARLLYGPRSAELVRWAAYSRQNTQLLVGAMTSPHLGMAVSDLLRSLDVSGLIEPSVVAHPKTTPASPPLPRAPSRVAQAPPPGP